MMESIVTMGKSACSSRFIRSVPLPLFFFVSVSDSFVSSVNVLLLLVFICVSCSFSCRWLRILLIVAFIFDSLFSRLLFWFCFGLLCLDVSFGFLCVDLLTT